MKHFASRCALCGSVLHRVRGAKDFCDRCWETSPIGQKQRRLRSEHMRRKRYVRIKQRQEV